jgi:hypothetical protein
MRPFHRSLAASAAIATACCACLLTLLKSVFRFGCTNGYGSSSGGPLRPTTIALILAAALAFIANVAFLIQPFSKRGRTLMAAIFSKWQPLYFISTSVYKLILRVIVIFDYSVGSSNERVGHCRLSVDLENELHSATFMWDCTILLTAMTTLYCDLDANFTPKMRRCILCILAFCLSLDAIGSYIWGNEAAGEVAVSVFKFHFLLDNQITSCITSQAVLAIHFLYVSCRSRHGRGWAYAPLRFELDKSGGASLFSVNLPTIRQTTNEASTPASKTTLILETETAEAAGDDLQNKSAASSRFSAVTQAHRFLLQFHRRQVSKCRVFVVPCLLNAVDVIDSTSKFAIARPTFNLRWLRLLQFIADSHPKFYFSFLFGALAIPAVVCSSSLPIDIRSIVMPILMSAIFVVLMGFLSSKRYNLDRIAFVQVVSSFRFSIIAALLAQMVTFNARRAFIYTTKGNTSDYRVTPYTAAAFAVSALCVLLCACLDCSPNLPRTIQIFVSVRVCNVTTHSSPFKD